MPKSYKIPFFTCLIKKNEKYLFIKRLPNQEWFPNKLSTIGGKIDEGESLIEGVRREVREEAGGTVKNLKLFAIGSTIYKHTEEEFYAFRFSAEYDSGELVPDLHEGDLVWLTKEEAFDREDMIPEVKKTLEKHWEDENRLFFYKAVYDTEDKIVSFEFED